MEPIVVNASPGPDQWATAIRYTLMTLSGIAGALGYSHVAGEFSNMLVVAAPLGGLVVFAMGQFKTRAQSQKLTAMATILPDNIAVVKKP